MTSFLNPSQAFEQILSALPHTQCTRCGYADCASYAQAIVAGKAGINQCPPGGAEGIRRLSNITGLPVQPLNPVNGTEGPRSVAVIDEAWCIGCTLCLKACPVDAIMGSRRQMHTVIESHCTGCALCLPVCPVDCISLENVTGDKTGWKAWSNAEAQSARQRYAFHSYPRNQLKGQSGQFPERLRLADQTLPPEIPEPAAQLQAIEPPADLKRAVIETALARARAQRERKI